MDRLFTPWRYQYITGSDPDQTDGSPSTRRKGVPALLDAYPDDHNCVFCNLIGAVRWAIDQGMPATKAEQAANILLQGPTCYLCLNAYPYSSGHVLVVPYQHEASLAALPEATATEIMQHARTLETALRATYTPNGLNFGLNLGEAAGAGVAAHLHLHALPRWIGDANFMTVIGETRVIPETLDITWHRLRKALNQPVS